MATEAKILTDYIEATPGVCGGKPRIKGTRMKVSEIYWRHELDGQSADEIIRGFPHLSHAQVYAALAYAHEHRDPIEAELRERDEAALDAMRKDAPHLLPE